MRTEVNRRKMTEDEIYQLTKDMTQEELFIFAEKYYGIPRDGWVQFDLEKCKQLSTEEINEIWKDETPQK